MRSLYDESRITVHTAQERRLPLLSPAQFPTARQPSA
jgi:hypothetical protein